jgi:Flp pilus assembly protein TadD
MFDNAIGEFHKALQLKPDYAEAHFNLGIIYLARSEKDLAQREFEAGLKIKPDDQKARQILRAITSR